VLGRDDRVQWRREVSWLSNFVVLKTMKFVDASDAFSFLSG